MEIISLFSERFNVRRFPKLRLLVLGFAVAAWIVDSTAKRGRAHEIEASHHLPFITIQFRPRHSCCMSMAVSSSLL